MFSKLFNKKKESELPLEQQKYNKLWNLYTSGELDDLNHNMYVLCDYEGGVNGEGHSGFMFNNENCITDFIDSLKQILPEDLYNNFIKAYESYESEKKSYICEACDQYFFENEQIVLDIIQEYANTLKL